MISHRLAGAGAEFGWGECCGFGCSLSSSLGFGCCCSCWRICGPPSCIVSACCESTTPQPSIFVVRVLSFCLHSRPCTTDIVAFPIMFVMPGLHSLASSWRVSYFCSLTCINVISPSHRASSQVAWTSSKFAWSAVVLYSCISTIACYRIILCMRLLQ